MTVASNVKGTIKNIVNGVDSMSSNIANLMNSVKNLTVDDISFLKEQLIKLESTKSTPTILSASLFVQERLDELNVEALAMQSAPESLVLKELNVHNDATTKIKQLSKKKKSLESKIKDQLEDTKYVAFEFEEKVDSARDRISDAIYKLQEIKKLANEGRFVGIQEYSNEVLDRMNEIFGEYMEEHQSLVEKFDAFLVEINKDKEHSETFKDGRMLKQLELDIHNKKQDLEKNNEDFYSKIIQWQNLELNVAVVKESQFSNDELNSLYTEFKNKGFKVVRTKITETHKNKVHTRNVDLLTAVVSPSESLENKFGAFVVDDTKVTTGAKLYNKYFGEASSVNTDFQQLVTRNGGIHIHSNAKPTPKNREPLLLAFEAYTSQD